jgi:phage-related protein
MMKPLIWVGTSRKDLGEFPDAVKDHIGYTLYVAQRGGKHHDTKTLAGFGGAGVVEVIKDLRGDTFRAVYTVRYAGAVYVSSCLSEEIEDGTGNSAAGH